MPTNPSLLIVPYRYKAAKLYSQLPESGAGDFTVTRSTTATRTNASGLLESVASGVPRLDYTGGGCPALLVEPAATNGILNSQDSSTNWNTGANLTSSLSIVEGINGRELQVAIAGSNIGVSAGRYSRPGLSFNLVSGSTYTISFIVKRTSTHSIFGYYALATNDLGSGFDVSNLTTGVLYSNADFGSRVRRITPLGNDEFLCEETFTMTASRTLTAFHVAPVAGVTNSANASFNSRIAFAAPQIELGAVATSRILTGNTTQTRNADVISLTAASGLIGQTQGTLYAELILRDFAGVRTILTISDNSTTNRIRIRRTSATAGDVERNLSGNPNASFSFSIPSSGVVKIALAYSNLANGFQLFINGSSAGIIAAATPTFSGALSQINLGANFDGTSQLNDRIRAAAIYTSRLSNSELATLTTL